MQAGEKGGNIAYVFLKYNGKIIKHERVEQLAPITFLKYSLRKRMKRMGKCIQRNREKYFSEDTW